MAANVLPKRIVERYEVHNFRHALEVLSAGCSKEFKELIAALDQFKLSLSDIKAQGGNESQVPKKIAGLLRPLGWHEARIRGDLLITIESPGQPDREDRIENFLDGHKVDFVKDRVAFDLEWNSKDQTFDRDLYAFRAFHEAGVISAAVLLTRSESLNDVFKSLGVMQKYGASTTWMGKLLYRMRANRNGGCPVLVMGITPKVIEDWEA
jgi:CRISPR-associated protein Csd2